MTDDHFTPARGGRSGLQPLDNQDKQIERPRGRRSTGPTVRSKTEAEEKGRFDPADHWGKAY